MALALTLTLLLATMSVGVMAGVFWLYANAIMPGLRTADDRTFIGSFQAIDRAIINPIFLTVFFGALVMTGLTLVLHIVSDEPGQPWVAAAAMLYLFTVVITMRVNVPRNDRIKAAGDPDRIGKLSSVRADFSESTWARWNRVRVTTTVFAFACLSWAVKLGGS